MNESILDAIPAEMLPCVLAFLPVKELPTFYSVVAMRKSSSFEMRGRVLKAFEVALTERSNQSILEYAPAVIKKLFKTAFEKVVCTTTARNEFANNISTLCVLLKYLELTETFSCEELEGDRKQQQFSWPVEIGSSVGAQDLAEPSQVIFSTPHFDPRLIVLSERWLSTRLTHYFPMGGPAASMDPDINVGVLSWSDGRMLELAHTNIDIAAGMEAYWSHPSAQLVWMSKAYRDIYPGAEDKVKNAEKLSWLLKEYDNNMLCYWEAGEGFEDISVTDDEVLKHVRRLVKSLEKHEYFQ